MSLPAKNKFDPVLPIVDVMASVGRPNQNFRDYMAKLDALVAALAAGNAPVLFNAVNDAAAAAGGVNVGQFYRNGSIVMQRQV